MANPEPSRDGLWGGRLVLWQPGRKGGYRFNLDPILLAGFVAEGGGPKGHVLDLGAGCGIIGLMLLGLGRAALVTAVERQPALLALLERNAAENGQAHAFRVLSGDLRTEPLPPADRVVFNPPYFERGRGHASPDPGRDAGRRELFGTLNDFVARGAQALAPGGRLCAVVPAMRAVHLEAALGEAGLVPTRRRDVWARAEGQAGHLLLEAGAKGAHGPGCTVLPPLVVHDARGHYTPEVQALLRGPEVSPLGAAAGSGPGP